MNLYPWPVVDAPEIKVRPPGPKAKEAVARDERYLSPSYTRIYPLVVAQGQGSVIEDIDGNVFLDFTAGIAVTATGHCHPDVTAAIQDQSRRLLHMSGTDFYYEPQIALAERLAMLAPGEDPKKVFFTNSGTEAIEAALKLARYHTRRPRVIAFYGAFHGRTFGAMSLSGSKLAHRRGFAPLVPEIHHVPYGCPIHVIEETLLRRTAPPEEVAAIFVEPILGEGGYIVPPDDFLPGLRELCDKHGILLVADEVQCGLGRTGKMFAVEHWNVVPDIVCVAKGIASGMPLGAMIARVGVMNWQRGSHASTFGGNPVSCRAALVTLDLLEGGYRQNAVERGAQLKAGLQGLARRYPVIGDVRGLGLMIGVEIVKNRDTMEPDHARRDELIQRAFERGFLLLGCGESTLRICPPLCVTAAQVEKGLGILDGLFAERSAAAVPVSAVAPHGT